MITLTFHKTIRSEDIYKGDNGNYYRVIQGKTYKPLHHNAEITKPIEIALYNIKGEEAERPVNISNFIIDKIVGEI